MVSAFSQSVENKSDKGRNDTDANTVTDTDAYTDADTDTDAYIITYTDADTDADTLTPLVLIPTLTMTLTLALLLPLSLTLTERMRHARSEISPLTSVDQWRSFGRSRSGRGVFGVSSCATAAFKSMSISGMIDD